jgi:hypothetical protein
MGRIEINHCIETEVPYILVVGDIQRGLRNQVVIAAVGIDAAGIAAEKLLQQLI